jgi:hypothetical protein
MQIVLFLAIAFLPPFISGPLPAMLALAPEGGAPRLTWRWRLCLVSLSAILLNLVAFWVIASHLDGLLPPGFFACMLTPIAAVATLIVALGRLRRKDASQAADPMQRKWLRVSLIAIALLQVLVVSILAVIAPALCGTALRVCTTY